MPCEYEILQDQNLIKAYWSGTLAFSQLADHFNIIHTDPKFKKGMNSIIDLSEADIELTMEDMRIFAEALKALSLTRGNCKWAFVSHNEDTYKTLHQLFLKLQQGTQIKINLFSNTDKAQEWINS